MSTHSNSFRVLVVGSGQMGSGIAQVAAQSSCEVAVYDSSESALKKSHEIIQKSLSKLAEKKVISETPEQVLARIHFLGKWNEISAFSPNFAIEAIVENFSVKSDLFKKLDAVLDPSVIFASNTSSISIGALAAQTSRASKFIGMHFMNPVPLMKLVEVIRGLATDDGTFEFVKSLAEKMGKTVVVSKDMPGFVVNRILMPMINEACFALQEGLSSAKDIDTAMCLGTHQPMGPLTLADFIGLDTCLSIMKVLHEGFGDSKYRPSPLLKQYVEAGFLGRKSGRGFFSY